MGASGRPGSEAQRDSSSSSLSPWSVPPLSVPRPCLSISSVSLPLGLWEAGPWLSTAPCFSREENQQNFAVARTYSCEFPEPQGPGIGLGVGGVHMGTVTRPNLVEWGDGNGRLAWRPRQHPLSFAVVRQAWPGPLGDTDSNVAATR